ncbi:hypothetical protein [Gordonia sp. SMJS1]|uniref:hypothetical protein n=1 Tax=Gordonia sp. SMJS1 TaxID=3039400 RepID=UPI002454567E|nr:hypothetical protein [Gordonia sp. SMJS1]WGJ88231.1 hypothetical protein QAD21_24940 [Gordonia sp. SMJS1]
MDHIYLAVTALTAVVAQIAFLHDIWRLRGRVGSYTVSAIAVLITAMCASLLDSVWASVTAFVVGVLTVALGFWLAFGPDPHTDADTPTDIPIHD